MFILLLALSIVLLLSVAEGASDDNSIKEVMVGKMKLGFTPREGFSLHYGGASIIKESTLWITNPTWTSQYYGYPQGDKNISIKEIEGGREVLIQHQTPSFKGQHRVILHENQAIFEFTYKLLAEAEDAGMEYNLGYVSAPLIAGCPFKALTSKQETTGTIPALPTASDWDQTKITEEPFKKLSIDTRIGKLTFEISGTPETLTMHDTRKMRVGWAEKSPIFWWGAFSHKIRSGEEEKSTVTITLNPLPEIQRPEIKIYENAIAAKETPELHLPMPNPIVIIPEPKEIRLLEGDFKLINGVQIVIATNASTRDRRGAESFADELADLYGIQARIVDESDVSPSTGMILVGDSSKNQMAAKAAQAAKLIAPEKEEGYAIQVTPEQVIVLGTDAAGAFYGMQTLKQLVKGSAHEISLQGCKIEDYPSLKFRGAHLFIGKEGLSFHKKLIDRIFTRYKLNHLVLEADYLQWKSCPEIAVDFSMSQDDLKEEIEYAREHFIEVSPLVQSLGHSEWMFENGQNLNLAEDPENPYAYCVSKPETYDFIFKIYDEALDLFGKSPYFHIGHDEVTLIGKYPNDEICKKKSIGDLVIDDILKLHKHLADKKVQIMMWGDMFLADGESPDATNAPSLEEAKRRRNALPKDIVFADWHYAMASPEKFESSTVLNNEGFENIASTWYTPANIANFAEAAKRANSLGLLQTTWAGYNSHEGLIKECYPQFTAFILAAEFAWNASGRSLDDLHYRWDEEFNKQWERTKVDRSCHKGFLLDLSVFYNVSLAENSDINLSKLPTGTARLKDDLYQLAENLTQNSAIRLASAIDHKTGYPEKIVIPIHQKAITLLFLHTSAWPDTPNRKIGAYTLNYSNGTKIEIPLIYGQNIAAWNDNRTCTNATVAWNAISPDDQKISLRQMEWKNPNPDQPVESIEFISEITDAGPILLALSGLTG